MEFFHESTGKQQYKPRTILRQLDILCQKYYFKVSSKYWSLDISLGSVNKTKIIMSPVVDKKHIVRLNSRNSITQDLDDFLCTYVHSKNKEEKRQRYDCFKKNLKNKNKRYSVFSKARQQFHDKRGLQSRPAVTAPNVCHVSQLQNT